MCRSFGLLGCIALTLWMCDECDSMWVVAWHSLFELQSFKYEPVPSRSLGSRINLRRFEMCL